MDFSENQERWQQIPQWVRFLLSLGYEWPRTGQRARRLALISLPCDSAASGLIALGAMVRDLGDERANDVDGHYDKLLHYARQYLEHCRACNSICHPSLKRCGYSKQATGCLRSPLLPRVTVKISDKTDFQARQIKWTQPDGRRNQCLVVPTPQHAKNYHIEDDPPVQWNDADGELRPDPYQALVPNARIIPATLRQSFSGLCFAGRATGERASRELCASIRFREGTSEYGLHELLTIHGWSAANLSRMAFFNPRTQHLDRNHAAQNLVIADGDVSFLRAIDNAKFDRSDVIGVIHRDMERAKLESVGAKILPNQWFAPDTDRMCELPVVPRGINIAILKERVGS